jgi:hypothetical protein
MLSRILLNVTLDYEMAKMSTLQDLYNSIHFFYMGSSDGAEFENKAIFEMNLSKV